MFLAHSAKGKIPTQSYQAHVSRVLEMALENAERIETHSKYGILLRQAVLRASVYHDLGKLMPENQDVLAIRSKNGLPFNHVDAGVAALQTGSLSITDNLAALLVYSHHIGLPSLPGERAKGRGNALRDISLTPEGKPVRDIVDKALHNYMAAHNSVLTQPSEMKEIEWRGPAPTSLCVRMALSCLVDADHTDTARHYNNVIPQGEILLQPQERLALLDKYVAGLGKKSDETERNELRERIYKSCRGALPSTNGFITCDSPVGTGKTTAVMGHLLNVANAINLRRIFVVLPFTNIIDQSVETYRKSIVLSDESPEKAIAAHHHKAEFEDLSSRVFSFLWNAPITVTTAVQFFETLASNRPASLRKLHHLAGSGIFIDEAHASLPAVLWPQAWKWLRELVKKWGCYVVLASGSLNRFWELEEFSDPPFMNIPELVDETVRNVALESESLRINYKKKDTSLNASEICDWIRTLKGPRLVILNTVYSAAFIASLLRKSYGDNSSKVVEHLSTALAPSHRKAILDRVKKRLENTDDNDWTLVATSCVEAGIDFSFRTAAREFCSLVSTIQTAGRINRSGEYGTSDLWNLQIVPGEFLRRHPTFTVSARILEELFEEEKVAPQYCREAMRREVCEKNQKDAKHDPIVKSEESRDFPSVDELFRVIPDNTVTAIIDEELCKRIEQHEKVDFLELQQKSVSIFSRNIHKFGLKPLQGFDDLHEWTIGYDRDFLGYMDGVLKLGNIESYVF